MVRQRSLRPYDDLRPDSPLRLVDACEIIFHGQLTPAALRREAAKGNLVLERIAGKDFVTPAAIQAMREQSRIGKTSSQNASRGAVARGARAAERDAQAAKLEALHNEHRAARKAKLAALRESFKPHR